MALRSTQPLTEMSTRKIPGGKGRPTRKADSLTAICEQISKKCGSLDVSQPYGPLRPVTGITLPVFTSFYTPTTYIIYQLSFSTNSFQHGTLIFLWIEKMQNHKLINRNYILVNMVSPLTVICYPTHYFTRFQVESTLSVIKYVLLQPLPNNDTNNPSLPHNVKQQSVKVVLHTRWTTK
jgi:hypothetical protein